jgi:hypothetical protein
MCTINSAVGITTGWTTEGSEFEYRLSQKSSFFHVVQTKSGAHPASYPMGTGGSFLREKQPGLEADHSPLTIAEVKRIWISTSTPTYTFMA